MTIAGVDAAIARGVAHLREAQQPDGLWSFPVRPHGPAVVEGIAAYLIASRVVGRLQPAREARLQAQLLALQDEGGRFGDFDGTVLAYQALKLGGYAVDHPAVLRAREVILAGGGIAQSGLAARRWLATLGEFPWAGVPTVPVEFVLLPAWVPFSLARLTTEARPAVVARMLQSAHRWSAHLAPELGVHELWSSPPGAAAVAYPDTSPPVSWRHLFVAGDRAARGIGYTPLVGLHRRAVARAIEWLLQRQYADGTWAADVRVTLDVAVALHGIGFSIDHPVLMRAWTAIDQLAWSAADTWQPSPRRDQTWQASQVLRALGTVGGSSAASALAAAVTTLAALAPVGGWSAAPVTGAPPCIETTATLVAACSAASAAPSLWLRGLAWAAARQSWNGGYATTEIHQTGTAWAQTVLADEIPLTDPPTPYATGRLLEALAAAGGDRCVGRAWRAIEFLRAACDPAGGWGGSVVQTAAALDGLAALGEPVTTGPFATAVAWLREGQRTTGEWDGAREASPAVATAHAVAALTAIAGSDDAAVQRGVQWLLAAQADDGSWPGGLTRDRLCYEVAGSAAPLVALGRYHRGRGAA